MDRRHFGKQEKLRKALKEQGSGDYEPLNECNSLPV